MQSVLALVLALCSSALASRHSVRGAEASTAQLADGVVAIDGCGAKPTYANAEPADFKDAKPNFYNTETKKMEAVTFDAGETIAFKCRPGFTTDGSKDGLATFDVDCTENGYYKPHGVCMKASKCGAVPAIDHAMPTGKVNKGKVEFACSNGYSLDGEKVLEGGFGKNRFFEVQCVEFSGSYEKFNGECKPYAFVPAGETIRIYNQVTEALFIVSCKGTLKKSFAKGETPAGLDTTCSKFGDQSSACQGLVSTIKADFERELTAREAHDTEAKKEWYEERDADRPGIGDEATTFCTEMWGLLELPK